MGKGFLPLKIAGKTGHTSRNYVSSFIYLFIYLFFYRKCNLLSRYFSIWPTLGTCVYILQKKLFVTEILNIQIKFYSKVAFRNWYLLKEIVRLATHNFVIKAQFSLKFSEVRKTLPICLSIVKISISILLFYRKNVFEKVFFFVISKVLFLLLDGCADTIFSLFWDI